MNIIGEKVKSPALGVGVVTEQDKTYIIVNFKAKTSKFVFPFAFEKFLKAENSEIQSKIEELINLKKSVENEKSSAEEAARKAVQKLRQSNLQNSMINSKDIDKMFSADYHASFLARHPILTYQQVEKQFGIKISGFGRGINSTQSSVVLISSIAKIKGNFVYHDRWTADGNYVYSGEGKIGNQSMTKGNLAIINTARLGKTIHLFVKFSPKEYYYQGVFELVNYTYEEAKDESGASRKEYKFLLRKCSSQ